MEISYAIFILKFDNMICLTYQFESEFLFQKKYFITI
jgi:hypothetical protein